MPQRPSRCRASLLLRAATAALLLVVVTASPALADPAKPSNYSSRIVTQPHPAVQVEIQGGDSYFVMAVDPGVEVVVPGYDNDDDFSDWEQLEVYLRVLPDGRVQENRNSAAFYQNVARYGASPEGEVGPEVPPDWVTVAEDGRIAWHDHRIHWMSPVPPPSVDTDDASPQRVTDYVVPIVVNGELTVAEGQLDYVADRSPVPVLLVALLGLVGGVLVGRRGVGAVAGLAGAVGLVATGILLVTTVGRATGFSVATPPVPLVAVGAVTPLLGIGVASLRETQRRGLVVLGGLCLFVFGLMSSGLFDPLVGGGGTAEGGFGSWWLRPTLPVDVAPAVLRLAMAAVTGLGAALLATVAAASLAVEGGLDGSDAPAADPVDRGVEA